MIDPPVKSQETQTWVCHSGQRCALFTAYPPIDVCTAIAGDPLDLALRTAGQGAVSGVVGVMVRGRVI